MQHRSHEDRIVTGQPNLWDPPAAPRKRRRHRTATTSSDALDRVRPVRPRVRQIVLDTVRGYGPMTRHEIADATGISLQSVCGRVAELMSSGEIREQVVAGRKIVRDGRHVLVATITQTQRAG
jgi:hypothetical protein